MQETTETNTTTGADTSAANKPKIGPRDRHEALVATAYTAGRMANTLPAAMALLKTIAKEMADAGETDDPCDSSAPFGWARQVDWIIEYIEEDTDDLRRAASAAGFQFGKPGARTLA